jgi:uncharacterized membrane protein YhiD involved in acid resistance
MNMNQIKEVISRLAVINSTGAIFEITLTLFMGLILGLIISYTYQKTHKGFLYSQEFAHNLIIVCIIISLIISVIGTNIARAFSLAGALSIIRFRSSVQTPRDIAFIFFAMGAGLACGAGLFLPAIIFVVLLSLFIVGIQLTNFVKEKIDIKVLKITLPESLNYEGLFDDIMSKYMIDKELQSARTINGGTVYELVYFVKLKKEISEKEMLDELRTRNGNFNISIMKNLPENIIN